MGTEHILLGIAQSKGSLAEQILSEHGAAPDALRGQVVQVLSGHATATEPPATTVEHTGKYRMLWQWLTQ